MVTPATSTSWCRSPGPAAATPPGRPCCTPSRCPTTDLPLAFRWTSFGDSSTTSTSTWDISNVTITGTEPSTAYTLTANPISNTVYPHIVAGTPVTISLSGSSSPTGDDVAVRHRHAADPRHARRDHPGRRHARHRRVLAAGRRLSRPQRGLGVPLLGPLHLHRPRHRGQREQPGAGRPRRPAGRRQRATADGHGAAVGVLHDALAERKPGGGRRPLVGRVGRAFELPRRNPAGAPGVQRHHRSPQRGGVGRELPRRDGERRPDHRDGGKRIQAEHRPRRVPLLPAERNHPDGDHPHVPRGPGSHRERALRSGGRGHDHHQRDRHQPAPVPGAADRTAVHRQQRRAPHLPGGRGHRVLPDRRRRLCDDPGRGDAQRERGVLALPASDTSGPISSSRPRASATGARSTSPAPWRTSTRRCRT